MEVLILNAFVAQRDTEKALSLLTPEIAKNGMVCGIDIFSLVTQNKIHFLINNDTYEGTEDLFSLHLDKLRAKKYRFNVRSKHSFRTYANERDVPIFHLCMLVIGGYRRSDVLAMLFAVLTRAQLEPFFAMHTMPKSQEFLEFYPKEEAEKHFKSYLAMQTAREKVRKAAIVLIGVADRNTKAVLRIIARVVWSERGDEGWFVRSE